MNYKITENLLKELKEVKIMLADQALTLLTYEPNSAPELNKPFVKLNEMEKILQRQVNQDQF